MPEAEVFQVRKVFDPKTMSMIEEFVKTGTIEVDDASDDEHGPVDAVIEVPATPKAKKEKATKPKKAKTPKLKVRRGKKASS